MSQELPRTAFHSLAKALAGGLERMLGKKTAEEGDADSGAEPSAPHEQNGAEGADEEHYVEFANLQAALNARNEGTNLERTTILQGAELAELRRNLGLLRPIGERLAEIEMERQTERAAHSAVTAELRQTIADKEAEPVRLRAELAGLEAALEAAETLRKALRLRAKEQIQRARRATAREKGRTAEVRQRLEETRAESAARVAELRSLKAELASLTTERDAAQKLLDALRGPVQKLVETGPKTTARSAKKRLVELMSLQPEAGTTPQAETDKPRARTPRRSKVPAKKKASRGSR